MSAINRINHITAPLIQQRKGGKPIVCLTAYSSPMASFLDPHVDLLIVGDSVGMVLYGMNSTLNVTLEMMIAHGAAVVRGSKKACIVVDMPFGSYQESKSQAFRNAAQIMKKTGADAVKLEGGLEMADTISFVVKRGIPVMGHVGLMPQSVNNLGGYKARGQTELEAKKIIADAKAVAEAGAFSVVVEGVLESVAQDATNAISIPTIGIGASSACDGQVLVTEDMLGLFSDFTPKFVKRFANLGIEITKAASAYKLDVEARRFPETGHCFKARK